MIGHVNVTACGCKDGCEDEYSYFHFQNYFVSHLFYSKQLKIVHKQFIFGPPYLVNEYSYKQTIAKKLHC